MRVGVIAGITLVLGVGMAATVMAANFGAGGQTGTTPDLDGAFMATENVTVIVTP